MVESSHVCTLNFAEYYHIAITKGMPIYKDTNKNLKSYYLSIFSQNLVLIKCFQFFHCNRLLTLLPFAISNFLIIFNSIILATDICL